MGIADEETNKNERKPRDHATVHHHLKWFRVHCLRNGSDEMVRSEQVDLFGIYVTC